MADHIDESNQQKSNPHSNASVSGFASKILIFYGIGITFLAVFFLLWYAVNVLLLVFSGILIAILLQRLSQKLAGWSGLPYTLSLLLAVGAIAVLIGTTAYLLVPRIAEQSAQLWDTIPAALRRLQSYLESYGWAKNLVGKMPPFEKMFADASSMLTQAFAIFSGLLGALGSLLIIVFVAIYFAAQPGVYINGLLKLVPFNKRQRGRQVFSELGDTLAHWLFGKLVAMVVVGVATGLGLYLLDVPLAITLGLIAGLFDFIPYIGPLLAGVPAVLIAFSQSPTLALYVIFLMIGLQFLESYLMLPLIERRTVSIPPALTISIQVLMGIPFGLLGIALATPLTASLCVLVAMLYVQDVLGDKVSLPSKH